MKEVADDEKGTTLLELLVVLALLSLVVAAVGSMYWAGLGTFLGGDTCTEIQDQARVGMDYMTRQLRQAAAIITVEDGQVVFLDSAHQKLGFRLHNKVLYRDFYSTTESRIPTASNPVAELVNELKFSSPRVGVIDILVVTCRDGKSYRLQTCIGQRVQGGVWK